MKQLFVLLLLLILSACRGAAAESIALPSPAAESAEVATPTLVPTATTVVNTPTSEPAAPPTEIATVATTPIEPGSPRSPTPAVATQVSELEPEVVVSPEPDWLTIEGKTAEGLTYLGNPDAAVIILDYSDFL